jgi:hypothetical protein
MNPHDEQKITARDEGRKARAARRASAAAFLPANDRFKQSYSGLTYLCVILATVAHFAVFEFFPQLQAADLGVVSDELSAIELPPEVKIPPPPEQIARPATPRVAAAEVSEDITIAPTTFEDNPVESLPPPPAGADPSATPSYMSCSGCSSTSVATPRARRSTRPAGIRRSTTRLRRSWSRWNSHRP